jgi:hypothetical protein
VDPSTSVRWGQNRRAQPAQVGPKQVSTPKGEFCGSIGLRWQTGTSARRVTSWGTSATASSRENGVVAMQLGRSLSSSLMLTLGAWSMSRSPQTTTTSLHSVSSRRMAACWSSGFASTSCSSFPTDLDIASLYRAPNNTTERRRCSRRNPRRTAFHCACNN